MTNIQLMLSFLPFVAMFYVHAFWLMPQYLFRRKRVKYTLLLLGLYLVSAMLSGLAIQLRLADSWREIPGILPHFRRIVPGLFFLVASASLGAFRENARLERERKEKETEHLRTELSFLRGQVNPHFMLNVLNSMVLLARRKSDLLEPVLMELARLMSYMIYESGRKKIRLESEIGYLQAYIDLQLLRFGDDLVVEFNTPQSFLDALIEPMLLIPLVENAFKHGVGLVEDPVIKINIAVDRENGLFVTVENRYNPQIELQPDRETGIGLANMRKRLELIYPGEHEFKINRRYEGNGQLGNSWFIATLNIPIQ